MSPARGLGPPHRLAMHLIATPAVRAALIFLAGVLLSLGLLFVQFRLDPPAAIVFMGPSAVFLGMAVWIAYQWSPTWRRASIIGVAAYALVGLFVFAVTGAGYIDRLDPSLLIIWPSHVLWALGGRAGWYPVPTDY